MKDGLRPIVVVTGGSDGIGLALARRFAAAGHAVALVARQQPRLDAAAASLRRAGADVAALALDVTAVDAAAQIEKQLRGQGYFVDVLVNNAGIGQSGDFAAADPADLARLVDLNVAALTRLMRHMLPGMLARRRGGVLNVASVGASAPGPYQAAYYASKAYVVALSEAVGWETLGTGVRIAVLAPGPVETAFHGRMGAEAAFYRRLLPAMSPTRIASAGYWGFRLGRRVIVPGLLWPLIALAARLTPHMVLLPIMGWLLRPRPSERRDARGPERG